MKKLFIILISLSSFSAFAGDYSITLNTIHYSYYNAGDLTEISVELEKETDRCIITTQVYNNGDMDTNSYEINDERCDKLKTAKAKQDSGEVCKAKVVRTYRDSYRSGKRQTIKLRLNEDCTCTKNSLYNNAGKNVEVDDILFEKECS